MTKQNVTQCLVWSFTGGKGNQFCINEGDGHPGTRGAHPNGASKDIYLKDYSSSTA